MDLKKKLTNYIRAGYSGLYLCSFEEKRVQAEMMEVAKGLGFDLLLWTYSDGLVGPVGAKETKTWKNLDNVQLGPLDLMLKMGELPANTIILAMDYHFFLQDRNPAVVRSVKDALAIARSNTKYLVALSPFYSMAPELEKEFTVVEFGLPDRDTLGIVMSEISDSCSISVTQDERERLLDAASGMTTIEAADAFALAAVEADKKSIPPHVVATEKANVVKKNGLLEIIPCDLDFSKIGGNALVKQWITKRRGAFSKDAEKYKLPKPKGMMMIGVPGCGKTLIGKAIAQILDIPLLKLDGGRLFGGLVGQSEANTRAVIQTAEAVAPCVLFIDELEKALSGSKSSGSTDGGTSARVLGTLLQWLQDKTSPVFVVATANDVSQLPPELLRKGRWDEMFFVDLPNQKEREEILEVVIRKFDREPTTFDVPSLAAAMDTFTGAEIEGVFVESLFDAFADGKEPQTIDVMMIANQAVPISRTMEAQITALRSWCDGRARRASEQVLEKNNKPRKIV